MPSGIRRKVVISADDPDINQGTGVTLETTQKGTIILHANEESLEFNKESVNGLLPYLRRYRDTGDPFES